MVGYVATRDLATPHGAIRYRIVSCGFVLYRTTRYHLIMTKKIALNIGNFYFNHLTKYLAQLIHPPLEGRDVHLKMPMWRMR